MIIDKATMVSDEQAVTASAASADYIDLKAAGDIGVSDMEMLFVVKQAVTAEGAATVKFAIQCDDNTSFSSPKTVFETGAIGKAALVAGYQIAVKLPYGLDERYVRAYYTVATGPLTAGKFSAAVVSGVQMSKAYPDAI
jgi:hypothetical protein